MSVRLPENAAYKLNQAIETVAGQGYGDVALQPGIPPDHDVRAATRLFARNGHPVGMASIGWESVVTENGLATKTITRRLFTCDSVVHGVRTEEDHILGSLTAEQLHTTDEILPLVICISALATSGERQTVAAPPPTAT